MITILGAGGAGRFASSLFSAEEAHPDPRIALAALADGLRPGVS